MGCWTGAYIHPTLARVPAFIFPSVQAPLPLRRRSQAPLARKPRFRMHPDVPHGLTLVAHLLGEVEMLRINTQGLRCSLVQSLDVIKWEKVFRR